MKLTHPYVINKDSPQAQGLIYCGTALQSQAGLFNVSGLLGSGGPQPYFGTLDAQGIYAPGLQGGKTAQRFADANSNRQQLMGADNFYTNGVTASVWVNTVDTGYNYLIVKWGGVANNSFHMRTDLITGLAYWTISTNGLYQAANDLNSTTVVNDGKWHLITATYDNITSKLYVDGKLEDSFDVAGPMAVDATSGVFLGGLSDGALTSNWLTGYAEDPRIYNQALTAKVIYSMWNPTTRWSLRHSPKKYWSPATYVKYIVKATAITDDALGTMTLNATLGIGNWGAFELGEVESNFHANAVGRTARVGIGTAAGDSTASAVGVTVIAGVGIAAGDSTDSAVGASSAEATFNVNGDSTTSGVGASSTEATFNVNGDSTTSAVGASRNSQAGTALGDSTANAVGISINSQPGTALGDSTANAVGVTARRGIGTSNGEANTSVIARLVLYVNGITSQQSVSAPTLVREVIPELKVFISDAVGIFEIDINDTETFTDDYGVLEQNIIFSGEITSAELVDPVVPKKKRLAERVQIIKVVEDNLNVFLPNVLELKHNLDKVKPLNNFFKTNNITLPGVFKVGKVNGDFIKLIYTTTGKEWRNTLHYSGRSTVDHQGSESWIIEASFGASGRSWKFTMKLSRTRGQLVETSRIIAFYRNRHVVNRNDSFFGFGFTINPKLLESKPDTVQPIVLSDSPGFFSNLQQLAFNIFPQNMGTGSHQFPADNTIAYDATLTGGVR